MRRPSRWFWLVGVGCAAAVALLYTQYRVFEDRVGGATDTLPRRLLDEVVGGGAALALFPLVAAWVRRHPLRRGRRAGDVAAHALGLVAFSLAHTALLAAAREVLHPAFCWPRDSYLVEPVARVFQELGHDVLGYGAFVAVYLAWDAAQARRDRELSQARLERALIDAQLQALRLQLQPHFLFNTLNTIAEAVYGDPRAADAMLQGLAGLLRATLHALPRQEVPLAEELALLAQYVAIMDARFGDRLCVRVDVAADAAQVQVPPLLLQPLVENVIQHGMTTARLEVDVVGRLVDGRLVLVVSDNGRGVDPAATAAPGVGLTATAERLGLLYQDAAGLTAGNRPAGGYQVRVQLPAVAAP